MNTKAETQTQGWLMRFLAVFIVSLLAGLSLHNASAAPAKKHNHNGRVHSHILPTTGVKHFHKHMHNGRAHIHPYSTKVGFKHSHNLTPRAKAWANAVKHEHGGRFHSHPLPRTGVKHLHKHRHGGRSHIHPLPVDGAKHFHQVNKRNVNSKPTISQSQKARMISGLSIKQQMDVVLGNPIRTMPKAKAKFIKNKQTPLIQPHKKTTSVMNKNTINKVLNYDQHEHDGRTHQHTLPATGARHAHKHAHAGRIHSHLIPPSNTAHTHPNISNSAPIKTNRKPQTTKKYVKPVRTIKPVRTVIKPPKKTRKIAVQTRKPKTVRKLIKPIPRKTKKTSKQFAESNRKFQLALRYEKGTGVQKNLPQAVNWYLRSAKQGNVKAQLNLASMYEKGEGTKRNITQAIRWYTTAAHNDDVNAQVQLGNIYARGINVPKNINEATKWYRRAANQGDISARANLNYLLEE